MKLTEEQIADTIKHAGGLNSGPVRLARVVSMAAKVDWTLLRRARLTLLAELDPGAEADLWAGSLVHSRGPDGFVLKPDIAQWLQRNLAADENDGRQHRLEAAGELMLKAHAHLPPALQLEERLTYWGLSKNIDDETLERELGAVVQALKDPARRPLTIWAERTLDRLPGRVQQLEPAKALQEAVIWWSPTRRRTTSQVQPELARRVWAHLVTLKSETPRLFTLRLADEILEIAPQTTGSESDDTRPPAVEFSAPATDPFFIEIRWKKDEKPYSVRVFPLESRGAIRLRAGTDIELRFADGSGFAVRAAPETPVHAMVFMKWENYQQLMQDRSKTVDAYISRQKRLITLLGPGDVLWVASSRMIGSERIYRVLYRMNVGIARQVRTKDVDQPVEYIVRADSPETVVHYPENNATEVLLQLRFTTGRPLSSAGDIGRRLQSIPQLAPEDISLIEGYSRELLSRDDSRETESEIRPSVFISHASPSGRERQIYNTLVDMLESRGFEVLGDQRLLPGSKWEAQLEDWLNTCDAAVLLIGHSALNSSRIQQEIEVLQRRRRQSPELTAIWAIVDNVPEDEVRSRFRSIMPAQVQFIDAGEKMSPTRIAEKIIAPLEFLKQRTREGSPEQPIWQPVARMLQDVSDSTIKDLAALIDLELSSQSNARDQLARALVDRITRDGIEFLSRVVDVLMADLKPDLAQPFVEQLASLSLNPRAAVEILDASQKSEAQRIIFLNCSHLLTAELYIRRAWMGVNQPVVAALPAISKEKDPMKALYEMQRNIARDLRIDSSDLQRLLPDLEQPVYTIMRMGEFADLVISRLNEDFPDLIVLLYGQSEYLNPEIFPEDRVTMVDTRLDEKEENVFVSEFRRLLELAARSYEVKKS
jgi:hypothetical protein